MKNILVGNGINIQYDKVNCAPKNIVLRMLLSFFSFITYKHFCILCNIF